jgi:hypothetical protein
MAEPAPAEGGQRVALGALLVGAVEGVVAAQQVLDRDALARLTDYVDTPQGALGLPPLWYTLADVRVDVEVAASVTRVGAGTGVRLEARLLNPTSVSLFGYQASSGMKVSLRLAPREAAGALPPLPPAT